MSDQKYILTSKQIELTESLKKFNLPALKPKIIPKAENETKIAVSSLERDYRDNFNKRYRP